MEPFLLKENTLQSKMLIGSSDRIIENKNYMINLLILNKKDLSDCIQTIVVVIKTFTMFPLYRIGFWSVP